MCIYNIQYSIYIYIRTQYHNHIYMHACVISNYIYKHLRKHAPIHRRSHTHHFPQQPTMSHVHQTCPAKGRRLRWVPATRLVRSYAIYFRLGVLKSPRKMWYKDIQGKFRQLDELVRTIRLTYASIGEFLLESSTFSGPPPASRCLQMSLVIPWLIPLTLCHWAMIVIVL